MARVYVASSWRNEHRQKVVAALLGNNHEVYDFANPPQKSAFSWKDVSEKWEDWSMHDYRHQLLNNPHVSHGFLNDYRAMQWADTCVLVLPCGRSSHLEAGYFNGVGKRLIIYIPERIEPDLMYLMANHICLTLEEVLDILE